MRGRRPAEQVRTEILDAAADVLLESGMAEFTIEGVAACSGASKTTIYKWWPSKGALALDAYFGRVEATLEFPDTGDVRADLHAQLTAFVRLLRETPVGRVVAELIGHAQVDPALRAELLTRYSGPRRALAAARLESARDRGQIRPDVDVQIVIDQLWGACYHRWLIPNEPLSDVVVDGLIGNVFDGIG